MQNATPDSTPPGSHNWIFMGTMDMFDFWRNEEGAVFTILRRATGNSPIFKVMGCVSFGSIPPPSDQDPIENESQQGQDPDEEPNLLDSID